MLRFLGRNAIFVLFPLVVVAIVFLGRIVFRTALSFGEWGEQSIVESTILLAREKVERVEQTVSSTDRAFFHAVDPGQIMLADERWQSASRVSRLIEAAAVVDEHGDIAAFFHRDDDPARADELHGLFRKKVIPLLDEYESLNQHKHLHREIDGTYRLITSLTTHHEGHDYTAVLLYDTDEVTERLFERLLGDVGSDRLINVVDQRNRVVFGSRLYGAGDFIVARRFPSTFYKWRLQLAPRSAALYSEQAKAGRMLQAALIPLSLAVIVLGLIVAYMSVVREGRLNRLKSDFIANVSHEFKTPLSLIRMFGELLQMKRVRDEGQADRYHRIILRETDRLTALIDKVLDFSKIERGKISYDFEPRDVNGVVERAVGLYRHRVDEMGARLQVSTEDGLPPVRIDEHAITLAVINLLDNAVKYAVGTDVIGVEIARRDGVVHLDVYDRGAGIPSHHLKRIFERFYRYQAGDLETRGQRGSGIGLSLVRHIARAHGGSVVVSSTPGEETRFSIRLPLKDGGDRATSPASA